MIWRLAVYNLGLLVLAFGVAFAINSNLGISPVNALPLVFSEITGRGMGVCVFVFLSLIVLAQAVILRRKFKLINITQVVFAFVFGYFVDLALHLFSDFAIPTYGGQLVMLGISIVLIACGIVLFMEAKLVNLPPEALVAAIALVNPPHSFHRVKIIVDSALVVAAVASSLLFLGEVYGVREGTVLSAVLIGKAIPPAKKVLMPFIGRVL